MFGEALCLKPQFPFPSPTTSVCPSVNPDFGKWIVVKHQLRPQLDSRGFFWSDLETHPPPAALRVRLRYNIADLAFVCAHRSPYLCGIDSLYFLANDFQHKQARIIRTCPDACFRKSCEWGWVWLFRPPVQPICVCVL